MFASTAMRLQAILRRLRGPGLVPQLIAFIVLPLTVSLIAIPIGSLSLHAQAMRELVGARDERAVRAAAAALTEQLNHRAASIHGIALHAATAESPQQALADYAFLLPDFDGGLALLAQDGALLAARPTSETWRSRPVTELIAQTVASGELQFSPVSSDALGGPPLMVVAATTSGVTALGAYSPAALARQVGVDALAPTGPAFAWLVDGQRRVLYQVGQPSTELPITEHPGVTEALSGNGGTAYLPVAGTEHVIAYTSVPPLNWALVVEEPWEAVDSPLLRQTQAAPLILIPVLLFTLLALGFGY
jgi:hypothetical protein